MYHCNANVHHEDSYSKVHSVYLVFLFYRLQLRSSISIITETLPRPKEEWLSHCQKWLFVTDESSSREQNHLEMRLDGQYIIEAPFATLTRFIVYHFKRYPAYPSSLPLRCSGYLVNESSLPNSQYFVHHTLCWLPYYLPCLFLCLRKRQCLSTLCCLYQSSLYH